MFRTVSSTPTRNRRGNIGDTREQRDLDFSDSNQARSSSEAGAVLILALVYIISVSLIVGALASWAMNDLRNTTNFRSASSLHYAVSSATNVAIQAIRTSPMPSATPIQKTPTPLGNCWTPATGSPVSQLLIDNYTIAVFCTTVEDLTQGTTRTVTFYSCVSTSAIIASPALCQANPILTVVEVFDDYPASGGILLTTQCNLGVGVCGEGQTLTSWIWH